MQPSAHTGARICSHLGHTQRPGKRGQGSILRIKFINKLKETNETILTIERKK